MEKLIIITAAFLMVLGCEKFEHGNIYEPTGFEGSYISNDFTYPPSGKDVNLTIKIKNGVAYDHNAGTERGNPKRVEMNLMRNSTILSRSIKVDSVHYIYYPEVEDEPINMLIIYFDFLDDPECGMIVLQKYDYEAIPLARMTGMLNAYKDDEFGTGGSMYTWAERLYFYDWIGN